MQSTDEQKRRYAIESWAFNRRDPVVRQLFPELLESPDPLPALPEGDRIAIVVPVASCRFLNLYLGHRIKSAFLATVPKSVVGISSTASATWGWSWTALVFLVSVCVAAVSGRR